MRIFDPGVLPKYPHLGPIESQIMTKFWNKVNPACLKAWYDVDISLDLDEPSNVSVELTKDWHYLKSLKIDCVLEFSRDYWICEIKPIISIEAFHQLNTYSILFRRHYPTEYWLRKVLICESCSNMYLQFSKLNNFLLYTV
jgi:hypothetical protein